MVAYGRITSSESLNYHEPKKSSRSVKREEVAYGMFEFQLKCFKCESFLIFSLSIYSPERGYESSVLQRTTSVTVILKEMLLCLNSLKYLELTRKVSKNPSLEDLLLCYVVGCLKRPKQPMFVVVIATFAKTHLKMWKLFSKLLSISGTMPVPARRLTSFPTFKRQKWTFHSYSWRQFPLLAIVKFNKEQTMKNIINY